MAPLTRRQHAQLAADIMRAARPLLPLATQNDVAYRYKVDSDLARDHMSIAIRLAAQGATYMDIWMFHVPVSIVERAVSFADLRRLVVETAAMTLVAKAEMAWITGEDYPILWPSRETARVLPHPFLDEATPTVIEAPQVAPLSAWDRLMNSDLLEPAEAHPCIPGANT